MLNLLPQRPLNSHARTATLPNALDPHTAASWDRQQSQNHEVEYLNHGNGQGLDIPSTILESSIPPPALKKHQRSHTENFGSSRHLPSLVTTGSPSTSLSTHGLNRTTQEEDTASPSSESRQASPTRSAATSNSPSKLSSWFQGESQPIKVGLVPSPTKEMANPMERSTATRPAALPHRNSLPQALQKPAIASRFSFFGSKASLAKSNPNHSDTQDELADLDVNAALYPAGPPDPFSPASFKNLQQQAEGVLLRLQAAYKERATVLRDMAAEKEALSEETQGAETRAKHLKMQLDSMSEQLAEQDKAMMNMVDELAQEKLARREEQEDRKRSVRLVEQDSPLSASARSRPRRSLNSDSGFESEDDSSAESIFSRRDGRHSPTMSVSSVSTDNSPETFHPREIVHSPTQAARLRIPLANTKPIQQSCTNCHGVRASDAWLVVSVLKEENQALKSRVGELEGALDGCLDVVGRLGG